MRYCFPFTAFFLLYIGVAAPLLADPVLVDKPSSHSASLSTSSNDSEEDDSELLELMDILEEETSVATKSKINSDYVPGMVTILQGEEMEALGKRNVGEALALVPGVKMTKTITGTPMVLARGIPFPLNNGNIKIMLNSMAMNSEVSGINSALLLLPIEQVERIEFIRGPSSSVYGNSAFMGLVNIITHQEKKRFYYSAGTDSLKNAGGQYFWTDKESGIKLNANLSIQRDGEFNAPVNIKGHEEFTSLILGLDYQQSSFSLQLFDKEFMDLNPPNPLVLKDNDQVLSLAFKQNLKFSDHWESDLHLTYRDNQAEILDRNYDASVMQAQMDTTWNALNQHEVLFSLKFDHYQLDEATLCLSTAGTRPNRCPQNRDYLLEDESWNVYQLSIQDQYAINHSFSLIAGIGVSRNEQIRETNTTPRVAFVWQMAEKHLLKGQYSKGFRSPTYFEFYDIQGVERDLHAELVDSYELGYIFKDKQTLSRITLFYSEFSDMIFPESRSVKNNSSGISKGIEFEWEQRLNHALKWNFNLSYTDSDDSRGSQPFSPIPPKYVSNWLGNLSLYFNPTDRILLTAHYRYVGKRSLDQETIDGFHNLDLNLTINRFINKHTSLRFGVKNVLDEKIIYFHTAPRQNRLLEYSGRNWWAQLSYNF